MRRLMILAVGMISLAVSEVYGSNGFVLNPLPIGPQAAQIRSQDIYSRPYRPGHIYGNTVRRRHSRGY
ncbi:MAG TPA: hypothetical protein VG713_11050 [Pirellulales bacterium]|jgi:hypothetical protein|nr:hypothetical protein [Pirellulales bacterium]